MSNVYGLLYLHNAARMYVDFSVVFQFGDFQCVILSKTNGIDKKKKKIVSKHMCIVCVYKKTIKRFWIKNKRTFFAIRSQQNGLQTDVVERPQRVRVSETMNIISKNNGKCQKITCGSSCSFLFNFSPENANYVCKPPEAV